MKLSPDDIIKKINHLKAERGTWESHWQELADFVLPNKNDINNQRTPGEKVNRHLLDNTAMQSNILLAGFLHSLLTNPNSQFFFLTTGDEDIDDRDDVRKWLQKTSKRMLNVLNNSNFQTEVHESYIDMGCFGTSVLSIEEDDETVVRFSARPIKSCFIEEDNKGQIVEVYRDFKWTISQIIDEFGEKILEKSRILQAAFKGKDPKKFEINHAVYPNKMMKGERPGLPWLSQYILPEDKAELRVSGFSEFPYAVPRWMKVAGEKYGRSPAMNALPDAKCLNLMVETTIRGAQKVVDPPIEVPDDGVIGSLRTRPGSIIIRRPGSDPIRPILNDSRIDFGFQVIEEKHQRIRDAFFIDQLQLRQGTPQMTATEVEARTEQALRFMGPILGRMTSEKLRPIIDRVFEIMLRRGMIEPAPEILRNKKLDVQYSSLIAKTQRQGEARSILRAVEQASPFISADPTILDNIDGDIALKKIWRINDAPQDMLRDAADVKKIREDRVERQNLMVEEELKSNTADNISKTVPALANIRTG
jgi:hypothetical protein